jgi:hypothetical protein
MRLFITTTVLIVVLHHLRGLRRSNVMISKRRHLANVVVVCIDARVDMFRTELEQMCAQHLRV